MALSASGCRVRLDGRAIGVRDLSIQRLPTQGYAVAMVGYESERVVNGIADEVVFRPTDNPNKPLVLINGWHPLPYRGIV